jgi:hypothetical protein
MDMRSSFWSQISSVFYGSPFYLFEVVLFWPNKFDAIYVNQGAGLPRQR